VIVSFRHVVEEFIMPREKLRHQVREVAARVVLLANRPGKLSYDQFRYGPLGTYISWSRRITTWRHGAEAVALAKASQSLPEDAVIVEIGSFLGASAVLLAGARKLAGSGRVHCVDPFDASGDAFSIPVYRRISDLLGVPLRQCFDDNIHHAGLSDWIDVHQGDAVTVAAAWQGSIDMLFLDGDQSYPGARAAYEAWSPFLRIGGIIAVHNSRTGVVHHESHDGHMRVVIENIHPPFYDGVRCVGTTTFARKMIDVKVPAMETR